MSRESNVRKPGGTPKKGNVAFDLLAASHGEEFAKTYHRDKIVQRPLFLKPTPKDDNAEPTAREIRQQAREAAKSKKRRSPGKPKPLSAKQKRALQIYAIPKDQQKYEIYVPLHRLWCGYMREILRLEKDNPYGQFVEAKNSGPLLASADYHGALVEVVRSRCVSRVGVRGIVVRDTKSTFEVVTAKNQLKGMCLNLCMGGFVFTNPTTVVPKEHTVFRFEIPLEEESASMNGQGSGVDEHPEMAKPEPKPIILELHGSNFEHRAPDRATRKVVLHFPDI
jgi:ribonuclease P protein subunit POP4